MLSETMLMVEFVVGANSSNSNSVSVGFKKVHTRLDLLLDTDDLMVDGNEKKIQSSDILRASYKSMLLWASSVLAECVHGGGFCTHGPRCDHGDGGWCYVDNIPKSCPCIH